MIGVWGVSTGAGYAIFTFSVDWSNNSIGAVTPRLSGSPLYTYGPSIVYDSVVDRYWVIVQTTIGGQGITNIKLYELHPTTFAVIDRTSLLNGDSLVNNDTGDYRGGYGRFLLNSDWRMLGVVFSSTGSVYAIKLPSSV